MSNREGSEKPAHMQSLEAEPSLLVQLEYGWAILKISLSHLIAVYTHLKSGFTYTSHAENTKIS